MQPFKTENCIILVKPDFYIQKITPLIIFFLMLSFSLRAQYVNTDELIIVPGYYRTINYKTG